MGVDRRRKCKPLPADLPLTRAREVRTLAHPGDEDCDADEKNSLLSIFILVGASQEEEGSSSHLGPEDSLLLPVSVIISL